MYRFIDLFCGIGGFRIALEKRGLNCVYSSDIDRKAREAYKRNFGEEPEGDITKIPANRIPGHDILCAGFPCQSFSIAGKQNSIKDSRGRLFYEIVRIAEYHQPYILFLENVRHILKIDNGRVIRSIETELNNIGYNLHKYILNSSFFGIPQSRKRVYFIALRKDVEDKLKCVAPPKTFEKVFLEDILEDNVGKDFFISRNDIEITKKEDDLKNESKPLRVGIVSKGRQGEVIYSPKGHSITITANGGGAGYNTGLYNTNQGIRRLTIAECKRVMGFSGSHWVSAAPHAYRQLGNAVIPGMVGHVWDNVKVL